MTHDPHHTEVPAQATFVGWLAIGLLGLMVVFTLVVLVAAMSHGFS